MSYINSGRFQEIDLLKGVLMILVILDHSIPYFPVEYRDIYAGCSIIANCLYSFFMPCFFMVSGFLYYSSKKGLLVTWTDKLKRLVVPYFFICGISLLAKLAVPGLAMVSKNSMSEYFHYYFVEGGDRWFVFVLIGIFLIIAPLKKIIVKNIWTILFTIALFYVIVISKCFKQIPPFDRFVSFGCYFLIGFLVKKYYSEIRPFLQKYWLPSVVLFIVGNVVISNLYTTNQIAKLGLPVIGSICMFSFCIAYSSRKNPRFLNPINFVGKYSLQYYMLNGCILMPVRFILISKMGLDNPWIVVSLMFILQISIATVCVKLFERYKITRFLLGY